MELSRPVLFPEEVAAHQHLAFYSAMKLGFCRLNSHIEALPMLDVNSSLLGCGTAPLQQLAHVPSMSWSTTEPTLPLNPYAWNQASFDENALIDSSCVCQEHNIARGLGNSLVLEDLTKGDDIYENLLASYMNEMSSNCTNADALVAIAQSNALLTHKHSRNDSFSGPLLESMHEYFPSHCTVQATQYILGSNFVSQSFLGQQQETAQYIFNIDSSHSRAGMQFMWPSSTQIFDSEFEINTDSPKENEQEKLAACFESCEQHHRAEQYPDNLQILMSDDFNPHQQFSHLQGECIPEANSAGSAVSSSVITDADTECSVHSERQLIATQLDRRHLQLDDSISFQKLSDNREAVKPFVTTNVKTSGSPLGNVAPPGKRQKGCFPLESASTSVDQHFRKSYSRELRGQSNAMKQSSQLCNELSRPHCERALSQQPNGACNLSPTSESDMKTAQRKLCITSIEPQSIAARQRRKKISERVGTLEKLVPGGNKLDTASMLDEAIKYVKFLQLQVQILESLGNDNNAWTADAVRDKYCAENMYVSGSGIQSNFGFARGTRPTSSLVLTEIIQHQLFKSGYCLMSLQQCPRLPSQTP